MDLITIIILSIIQGLTEFLPVSSSGHLGLFHCFTDQCDQWDAENVTMDIAVHVGTLFSVIVYFYRDILKMFLGLRDIATQKGLTPNAKLLVFIIISSAPVILCGLILHIIEPDWLKTLHVIAWATVIFGIILWHADAKYPESKTIDQLTFKDALIIGAAQILALIPGTSRSGITMTAARYLGFSRAESAHYSLLLAIIAISGAGALMSLDVIKSGNVSLGMDVLIATILSFISGLLAIAVMMRFLKSCTFKVFAIYRIALGGLLLALLYGGYIA
ncbi:MAG: undecaprenyl-diphosphate phosphatase [Alphaproteobacteria bacterium]|nr:undecaprenyl-diphosphate phosphatase [Alphaproteobacteria bacterium]